MSLTINYVICVICNQRIICYLLFFISVILSVLSNKTNLILGYSSPLSPVHRASLRLYAWEASYILCLYGKLLLYSTEISSSSRCDRAYIPYEGKDYNGSIA